MNRRFSLRLTATFACLLPVLRANAAAPPYAPTERVDGIVRVCGSGAMGRLLSSWETGFQRYQPGVHFTANLKGSATGIFGLSENVADLALLGRQMYTYETYGIYRRSLQLPVEVVVANGSVATPRKSYALAVFVHRDNPLARLTVAQLDGIFGAQRTGGWQGLSWISRGVSRTAANNLRTWGQLGLTGAWAARPIHPYGPPSLAPGGVSFFQTRVMGGADTRAEDLREYDDPVQMIAALARDPAGIAYTGLGYATPDVKPIALAATPDGPFVALDHQTVADGTYPLARQVYLYFAPDTPTGNPRTLPPALREFIRYILSAQGQADVAREGDYIPLADAAVAAQRTKLGGWIAVR